MEGNNEVIIYAVRILKNDLWLTIRTYAIREEAELFARENLNNEVTPWDIHKFNWEGSK
jgi:hypothetical protein